MPQTFPLLVAAGVLLAAAVPDPFTVTLLWLRLAGIIALAMLALSLAFFLGAPHVAGAAPYIIYSAAAVGILGHLALVQTDRRNAQRTAALQAALPLFCLAVVILPISTSGPLRAVLLLASYVGVAAAIGLSLMDMLLGHAYLTAGSMSMNPFARLNNALALTLLIRALMAGPLVLLIQSRQPVPHLWGLWGLLIGTRWLVGLLVPAVFVYMARDCIKRRATQSATGILYVAGVLIFVGELIALHLAHQTAMPF